MADVHNKSTRSYNMSRIRDKDTTPEMIVRKFLHSKGYRYRLHDKKLPGKPDLVLPKYKIIIKVNGCFWHGHKGCKYFKIPNTRKEWWKDKIDRNKERDVEHNIDLKKRGWNVITIWECDLKPQKRETTLKNILLILQ